MKWKKIISTLLITAIVALTVGGCSKIGKQKTENENDTARGRYVEKNIKMPKAIEAGDEIAYQMIRNPEGKIQITCFKIKAKNGDNTIQYTLNKDNTWNKTIPNWLKNRKGDISIAYAKDGTEYALVSKNGKEKCEVHILKTLDGNKAEEVDIEDFKKPVSYKKAPMSIEILSDNSILLPGYESVVVYKDGKAVINFETGDYNYAQYGNTLITLNKKRNGVNIIDLKTGKTISEAPLKDMAFAFAADKDNWYMVNDTGIHRMGQGGSTWETIVDGSLASMSVPSMFSEEILKGDNDDYYVMFQSGNGKRDIRHYVYDKNVPTTPSKTLSVISLNEDYTVRQAILDYQQKHRDVKVEYRAVMRDNEGTTVTDQIKAMNTELLAGKGADIYIMDGMPVDSYIEKGALADISNIIKPLVNKGVILKNIMNSYENDGKIYTAPLRVMPTFAFGKKEAVEAAATIETLAEYAKNKASAPLMGNKSITYKDLTTRLFNTYFTSYKSKDGGFNKDGLKIFLKDLKIISNQTGALKKWNNGGNYEEMNSLNEDTSLLIYNKQAELGITDISHMYYTYVPIAIIDKTGGTFSTINQEYYSHGLVGLNNAGKQKKLASEFIEALFSEKVQKAELGDGYPVNVNALDQFGLEYDDYLISLDKFEITQPSKEKMQNVNNLCKTLTTPIKVDEALLEMVLKETIPYLNDEVDLNETVDKIMEKTKAYLLE